jgi:hypothetical protein
MTDVLVGIGIAFRSLWRMISVLALFLPAVVSRAKLEESALSKKFSSDWGEYANQTKFMIPFCGEQDITRGIKRLRRCPTKKYNPGADDCVPDPVRALTRDA